MNDRRITVDINGVPESVPENATIFRIIRLFKEEDVHLVVEHNGRFVYPQKYATTPVREGDRIEFINPNFGG